MCVSIITSLIEARFSFGYLLVGLKVVTGNKLHVLGKIRNWIWIQEVSILILSLVVKNASEIGTALLVYIHCL